MIIMDQNWESFEQAKARTEIEEYLLFDKDFLKNMIGDIFYGDKKDRPLTGGEQALMHRTYPKRRVKLYTNDYGYDLFEENIEKQTSGTKRIYLGKKVMRLLRINSKIFKSASGRYFKIVKI